MRNHKEIFERIKSKTEQYEAEQRRKKNRWQLVIGVVALVAVVAVTIPLYQKFGSNRGNTDPANSAGETTPTAAVTAEPTGESAQPTEPVQPTEVLTPTPVFPDTATFSMKANNPFIRAEYIPGYGHMSIYPWTLEEAIQMVKDDDTYFAVEIEFYPDYQYKINTFYDEFVAKYEKDPAIVQYEKDYYDYVKNVYYKEYPEAERDYEYYEQHNPWVVFEDVWRASHTEEEWNYICEIRDIIDRYPEYEREFVRPLLQPEIDRICDMGAILVSDTDRVIVLMTKSQIEGFIPSENYAYFFVWAYDELEELEGFTALPPKEPVPVQNPYIIRGDGSGKLDEELTGCRDADEIVSISVEFGNAWDEGQRIFMEQYPEEYAAYNWLMEQENPVSNDDPRVELGLTGRDLKNSLPGVWEREQEAAFFEKYPQYQQYKPEYEYVHSLYLEVPYKLVEELAALPEITRIWAVPVDDWRVEAVGAYHGKWVYDLRGTPEEWY